jgi:hypothetical protein
VYNTRLQKGMPAAGFKSAKQLRAFHGKKMMFCCSRFLSVASLYGFDILSPYT